MEVLLSDMTGKDKMSLLLFMQEIQSLKIISADGIPKPYSQASEDDSSETFYYDDTCQRGYGEQIGYPVLMDSVSPGEAEITNSSISSLYWENKSTELRGLQLDIVLSKSNYWFFILYADEVRDAILIENGTTMWW